MNISIRGIFLLSIWLITSVNSFSQYYVKFKGDSLAFEKDSVVLALDKNISNNLHWEISKDTVTWESLNKTNDTLVIRIHDNSFYRAVLEEGTCYPIKSDVAFAGFKSIEVSDNTVVIDSTGGVYILSSGIQLVVPPGAVNETVTVSLDLLDSLNAELLMPFDADTGKVFCAAIHCEPIHFLKPVKISIPAPNFQYNDLPCVYRFNTATEFWEKYTDKIICSEKMQLVEFTTYNLTSTRIQLIKNVFEFDNTVEKAKQDWDCKEGFIQVESSAHDFQGQMGSNECYVISDETKVMFLECPGSPVNNAKIEEIGKDCEPVVTDNMNGIKCLKKDESATINIKVTIGGKPLKDQHIDFYQLPDGLTIDKKEDFTNAAGEAQFKVTCTKENFSGTIGYRATYVYYLQVIQASAGGVVENNENHPQTGQITNEHRIKACPILTKILLTNVLFRYREVGDKEQLNCNCIDQHGYFMDCGDIDFELLAYEGIPGAGFSIFEGEVTATGPGVSGIRARSGSIVSNTIVRSVAYEGDLTNLSQISDHNIYKQCGCREDFEAPPHEWKWWVVGYSGSLHVKIHLNPDLQKLPVALLTGTSIIDYSISASSICTPASFHETIRSHSYGWLPFPDESISPYIMENIVNEKKCIVEFTYEDFRGFYWHVFRGTIQLNKQNNEIEFSILDWRPDGCILRDVEGTCILK